jgi:hypothetical protein
MKNKIKFSLLLIALISINAKNAYSEPTCESRYANILSRGVSFLKELKIVDRLKNKSNVLPYDFKTYEEMNSKLKTLGYSDAEIDQLFNKGLLSPEFVNNLKPVISSEGSKEKNIFIDKKLIEKQAIVDVTNTPAIGKEKDATSLDFTSDGKTYAILKNPELKIPTKKVSKSVFGSNYLEYSVKNSMGIMTFSPIKIESITSDGKYVVRVFDREKRTMKGFVLSEQQLKKFNVREAPGIEKEVEMYKKQFSDYEAEF